MREDMTAEPIEGLAYIKIKADMAVKLRNKRLFPSRTAAAKYLLRYVDEFFFGESDVKLPQNLEERFEYAEESNIKTYRNAVINGSKNHPQIDPQPAETPNAGTTDPKTDPQTTIEHRTESTLQTPQCSVYGDGTPQKFVFENPPTIDEVHAYAEQEEMLSQLFDAIPQWYEHHQRAGWVNGKGEPLRAEVLDKETGEVLSGWQLFLRKLNAKMAEDVGLPADYEKTMQPEPSPTPESPATTPEITTHQCQCPTKGCMAVMSYRTDKTRTWGRCERCGTTWDFVDRHWVKRE